MSHHPVIDETTVDDATANRKIGQRVYALMCIQRKTHDQLAQILRNHKTDKPLPRSSISNRLNGDIKWGAVELLRTAAWLGVPVTDLFPPDIAQTVDAVQEVLIPIDEPLRQLPEGAQWMLSLVRKP